MKIVQYIGVFTMILIAIMVFAYYLYAFIDDNLPRVFPQPPQPPGNEARKEGEKKVEPKAEKDQQKKGGPIVAVVGIVAVLLVSVVLCAILTGAFKFKAKFPFVVVEFSQEKKTSSKRQNGRRGS